MKILWIFNDRLLEERKTACNHQYYLRLPRGQYYQDRLYSHVLPCVLAGLWSWNATYQYNFQNTILNWEVVFEKKISKMITLSLMMIWKYYFMFNLIIQKSWVWKSLNLSCDVQYSEPGPVHYILWPVSVLLTICDLESCVVTWPGGARPDCVDTRLPTPRATLRHKTVVWPVCCGSDGPTRLTSRCAVWRNFSQTELVRWEGALSLSLQ